MCTDDNGREGVGDNRSRFVSRLVAAAAAVAAVTTVAMDALRCFVVLPWMPLRSLFGVVDRGILFNISMELVLPDAGMEQCSGLTLEEAAAHHGTSCNTPL